MGRQLSKPAGEGVRVDLRGPRFDYGSIPSSVANFLQGQADRIRRHSATSIVQIGKALNESKRHLSHGAFLNWIEWEVCLPARTAQAYMRVANWVADKGAAVAHLSPSILYLLSASGTPAEFVADILRRAEAGERITPSVIRDKLKALRAIERPHLANLQESQARRASLCCSRSADELEITCGVDQLVAFLVRVLSISDFERVRELATSSAVLSDPGLAKNLERAFSSAQTINIRDSSDLRNKAKHSNGSVEVRAVFDPGPETFQAL